MISRPDVDLSLFTAYPCKHESFKVLAENGMQSEIRENAFAVLNDRPPFINIDVKRRILVLPFMDIDAESGKPH